VIIRPNKPLVYIPAGAKLNIENKSAKPPKVKYEERKAIYNREIVKDKVTGKQKI